MKIKSYSTLIGGSLLAAVLVLTAALPAQATPAPDGNSVLILSTTNGSSKYSAEATAQGFTPVVVDATTWASYSTADFASFRAIILGDPTCGGSPSVVAAAQSNTAWGTAVTLGPKLIIGTDEALHSQGAQLITSGLGFVTSDAAHTGIYISLSCYYAGDPSGTPVPVLDPLGTFTVEAATGGCYDDAHIVASHPALTGLTDASLSNWGCSVHEVFNSFPSGTFIPLAIARNQTGTGEMTFGDGTSGIPYILASGAGIVAVGTPQVVPTLSPLAMGLLVVCLMLGGLVSLRRGVRHTG
ncbi:MAG: hypothetical protein WBN86_01025 [Porticoccaceae bacterium]